MSQHFIICVGLAAAAAGVACSDSEPAGPRPSSRPAALAIVNGDGQTGTVAQTLSELLVVRVTDARSRPVRNATVQFRVLEGGGSIVARGPLLTDSTGIASAHWSLGTSATAAQVVEARVIPDVTPPLAATFRATSRPAREAAIVVLTPSSAETLSVTASFSDTLRVRVTDIFGNGVPQARVQWSAPNGGSLDADSTGTESDGTSSNRWTLRSVSGALVPGAYAITASPLGTGLYEPPVVHFVRRVGDARLTASVIALGQSHSCAIAATGGVWCWGLNTVGQLGDGTRTSRRFAHAVASDEAFRAIAAGREHTCALDAAGQAFCWGSNAYGELGDGTHRPRDIPVRVAGGHTFVSLAAGSAHTCGITDDGSAYCWGDNADGQLGDGTTEKRLSPTAVVTSKKFASLVAGLLHTCGLTTTGETMCWGSNELLQLGTYIETLSSCDQRRWRPCSSTPLTLLSRYVELAAGLEGTCALTAQGEPWCWGWGLAQTRVESAVRFRDLAAGSYQTCGVTDADSVFCWAIHRGGYDFYYEYETTIDEPRPVSGSFLALRIGGAHTCGIAAGGPATVLCWGDNRSGQLGDASITSRRDPTPVLRAGRP